MDTILGSQPLIITLDVDAGLFSKINEFVKSGFTVVEINSVDIQLLQEVVHEFPSLHVGAGNISHIDQLELCQKAGVHFITSPGLLPAIIQTAAHYSISCMPGVATLSEAMHAASLGCQYVRPLPAHLNFCTLLNKYLPRLRLCPAEIEWEEAEHFLNLPSVACISMINPEIEPLNTLYSAITAFC